MARNWETQATWAYHNSTKHTFLSVRSGDHVMDLTNQPRPWKLYADDLPIVELGRSIATSSVTALDAIGRRTSEPRSSLTLDDLTEAFVAGAEVKIAVRGLCDDLSVDPTAVMDHEVFIHLGACYYYTEERLFMGSANPVVRTRPSIPLGYSSRSWDFGWLIARSDGHLVYRRYDPYSLATADESFCGSVRWLVR